MNLYKQSLLPRKSKYILSPNAAIRQCGKYTDIIGWEPWQEFKKIDSSKNTAVSDEAPNARS